MGRTTNTRVAVLISCLVIAAFALAAARALAADDKKEQPAEAAVAKWQHLAMTHDVKRGDAAQLGRQIVKLGKDGWELVTVANQSQAGTTTKTVFYFKRPL